MMQIESELMRISEIERSNRMIAGDLYTLARSFKRPGMADSGLEQELSDIEARLERLMGEF